MTRSMSVLIVGVLLALIGVAIASSDGAVGVGYVLLGLGGLMTQVGVIGLGVRMGMRDFHEPTPGVAARAAKGEKQARPWEPTES